MSAQTAIAEFPTGKSVHFYGESLAVKCKIFDGVSFGSPITIASGLNLSPMVTAYRLPNDMLYVNWIDEDGNDVEYSSADGGNTWS